MRVTKYFCNGCKKEVHSKDHLMDFILPSKLAGGSALHIIHDRCSDCAKPIWKAIDKMCKRFGY